MKTRKKCWLGLALAAGLAQAGWAQVPAAPAAPAVVAVPVGALGAPVVPAPLPGGVMGNLITTCNYCKAKLCNSPLGQLLNNSLRPIGTFSGGIVGPLCPPDAFNPADLAKPPDSVAGAAARIKADSADAAARRAAVRYLAHADCHYWPEAQAALIGALRVDRNECVRWEAAMALDTGCCCTPKTILALSITVSGSEEDGNPGETSERVRAAAAAALSGCVSRLPAPPPFEVIPDKEPIRPDKERPDREPAAPGANGTHPAGGTGTVAPASYYQRADGMPNAALIAKARQALEQSKFHTTEAAAPRANGQGSQGLIGLAREALNSSPSAVPADAAGSAAQVVPAPSPTRPLEPGKDAQPVLIPVPMTKPSSALPPAGEPAPVALPPLPAPSPAPALRPVSYEVPASSSPAPSPAVSPYAHVPPPRGAASPAPAKPAPQSEAADLIAVLGQSSRADHREWAAGQFDKVDWHANPRAVEALWRAARGDAAAPVRLACVRALDRMNVNTPDAMTTLHVVATTDDDARVRDAARRALAKLQ